MSAPSNENFDTKQTADPFFAPAPLNRNESSANNESRLDSLSGSVHSSSTYPASEVRLGYPTPPNSASPQTSSFPKYHDNPFETDEPPSPRRSNETRTSNKSDVRKRGSSLAARFPGDTSHRPLDMIRAEQKTADRSRRRATLVGPDTIDQLDRIGANGIPYHHDGPYDATLLARNLSYNSSPVAATQGTNVEAIRATPQDYIDDSLQSHKPLWGTATIPPGDHDGRGRLLQYEEGPNLNVEMGWRRWEGVNYHDDDIKGKGEPAYTLDKLRASKESKSHRRVISEGGIELRTRVHPCHEAPLGFNAEQINKVPNTCVAASQSGNDEFVGHGIRRANTTGKRTSAMASAIRSRFGSLRKRRPNDSHSPLASDARIGS